MSTPARAAVRPRFDSPETGDNLLLEEAIRDRFERGEECVIWLTGEPGSGKSAAIDHLRLLFQSEPQMLFVDGVAHLSDLKAHVRDNKNLRLVLCTTNRPETKEAPDLVWTLSPWTRDELIEYLLATHPQRCAAVMSRVTVADLDSFGGRPELWRPVLDQLATHDELPDARSALRTVLRGELSEADWQEIGPACLEALQRPPQTSKPLFEPTLDELLACRSCLLRHRPARFVLAVEFLVERITGKHLPLPSVACHLASKLILAAAGRIRGHEEALQRLQVAMQVFADQPLAASLLHAVDPYWKPNDGRGLNLQGAQLSGVEWPKLNLKRARADVADFSHAGLSGVRWRYGSAISADFRYADLEGADLSGWRGYGAKFTRANLTSVIGRAINLEMASLIETSLCDADLRKGRFVNAMLRRVAFQRAKLCGAQFHGERMEDCDFQDADLSKATLSEMDLRSCNWDGVTFRSANLSGCNLEGMELHDVDFTRANLENALLTDSSMTGCRLNRAFLCNAGLAGVEWEGVSLRYAEMAGASFHLGSSRSGLVGSPIACEGSRTGFYTDEFLEQDYRPPEEIRKANLCGADLRGADIEGVDFYLVDLRGARYDSFQREYFRRCGAILENRCPQ